VAIQGNLDPSLLLTDPRIIEAEVRRTLGEAGDLRGYIFNLGHGVHPQTPWKNAKAAIEAAQRLSREMMGQ
jgi:uroporphyrinogen decarboxylase